MPRFFFAALVLIAASIGVSVFATPAVAATYDGPLNQTQTPDDRVSIQLSDLITIKDWSHQNGEFRITVHSAGPTNLVISDAMAIKRSVEGLGSRAAEIPRRSYTLQDGTQTIVFDAESYQGESAIAVASRDGAYLLKTGSTAGVFSGPFSTRDLQVVALAAALSVALVMIYKTYRHFTGQSIEPERVA